MELFESEELKQFKSNIVKWYDFKENSNILLVGDDFKEIMDELSSKFKCVLFDIKSNYVEKFDYILIKDNLKELENVKGYLKTEGTILLILNNRFGISNFAGADNFNSICDANSSLFSKTDIENALKNEGFLNYKFFYPLPNYEIANSIFSDDYLPEYNNTKLLYNNVYGKESTIVFDEVKALKQLTRNGDFKFFANSYFVEINPKSKVKFASFNNLRKEEFRLCTKIYDDYVEKVSTNLESQKHIGKIKQNINGLKSRGFDIIDKEENKKIISKYMSEKSLYEILLALIDENKIQDVYELIEKWFNFIKLKFDEEKQVNKENGLNIVKNAYIDLVFENTFFIDDKFVFFDQEWNLENLPIEFILYRAINNLYVYNPEISEKLSKEDIFSKFELSSYIDYFEKSEENIQAIISDEKIVTLLSQSMVIKNSFIKLREENNLLKSEEEKKEKYIEELTIKNGDLTARKRLLEIEEKKKEEYIEKISQENVQNSRHISELENIKSRQELVAKQKDEKIDNLNDIINNQNEIINNLNEIIKVKDNQIQIFENMKLVKLTKKLRGIKD